MRHSPDIDEHKPVSRQHEMPLYSYFQWSLASSAPLWDGDELAAALHNFLIELRGPADATPPERISPEHTTDDAHLWSVRALRHYGVQGDRGHLGRMRDVLIDPDTWTVPYLVVDSGSPMRVNRFLVPVGAVRWISSDARRLRVTLAGGANGAAASHGA